MKQEEAITTKENVQRFNEDVLKRGSYAYTDNRFSARIANQHMSNAITQCYDFSGKNILDLGCGDGTYTLEFALLNPEKVLGIDPAQAAIDIATRKVQDKDLNEVISFEVGDIYKLTEQLEGKDFDCIVLRGVLHHLPDPEKAIAHISSLVDSIIIVEPNGYNPVLKFLEKFSKYHIEHEERSFFSKTIQKWCVDAGLNIQTSRHFNLVPMFCPDWMAKLCVFFQPIVERIPLVRELTCGQVVIVARK